MLSFYATGSYQKPIGMSYLHGLSQSGVSHTVREVTNVFNHPNILRRFIQFPQTVQKRQAIINGFSNKFQISGCLGCIDCTHVALVRPNENEERFFNRKHYHSRNVQIVSLYIFILLCYHRYQPIFLVYSLSCLLLYTSVKMFFACTTLLL
nr:unnamed protein product [Callosobruchus chinensis]